MKVFQTGPQVFFSVGFKGNDWRLRFCVFEVLEKHPEIDLTFAYGQVIVLIAEIVVKMNLINLIS